MKYALQMADKGQKDILSSATQLQKLNSLHSINSINFRNIYENINDQKYGKNILQYEEVPVGAVIVYKEKIIAKTHNLVRTLCDPTAHAEILAIRRAALVLQTRYLVDCDIYVTLEPCPMCSQAIALSRIRRLYFGAYSYEDRKNKYYFPIQENILSRIEVYGGIQEKKASHMLSDFFRKKRRKSTKNI